MTPPLKAQQAASQEFARPSTPRYQFVTELLALVLSGGGGGLGGGAWALGRPPNWAFSGVCLSPSLICLLGHCPGPEGESQCKVCPCHPDLPRRPPNFNTNYACTAQICLTFLQIPLLACIFTGFSPKNPGNGAIHLPKSDHTAQICQTSTANPSESLSTPP